jgi:hypothetical protein
MKGVLYRLFRGGYAESSLEAVFQIVVVAIVITSLLRLVVPSC